MSNIVSRLEILVGIIRVVTGESDPWPRRQSPFSTPHGNAYCELEMSHSMVLYRRTGNRVFSTAGQIHVLADKGKVGYWNRLAKLYRLFGPETGTFVNKTPDICTHSVE